MRYFKKEQIQKIIELYLSGLSTVAIAKQYKSKANSIRSVLLRNGVKLRTISEAMRNIYYDGDDEKVAYQKLLKAIKGHFHYFMWKSKVAVRDNFTCQICGIYNDFGKIHNEMHIDHIKPFIVIFRENNIKSLDDALSCKEFWDISNGRCLCATCHRKTSTYSKNQIKT